MVLGSMVLAEAALRQGRWAACFHAFGPEARGGAARADVVMAEEPLDYPISREVDVLVALTQEAADRHAAAVRAAGLVLADSGRIHAIAPGSYRTLLAPLFRTAREVVGADTAGNVTALGVLCALTELVSEQALVEAIQQRFRGEAQTRNRKALEAGLRLGRALREVRR